MTETKPKIYHNGRPGIDVTTGKPEDIYLKIIEHSPKVFGNVPTKKETKS